MNHMLMKSPNFSQLPIITFELFNLSLFVRLCDTLYISNISDQMQLT